MLWMLSLIHRQRWRLKSGLPSCSAAPRAALFTGAIHYKLLATGADIEWPVKAKPMKIPILIETTSEQRYRATACEPFVGSAEADTPQAVLEMMKQQIDDRVAQGACFATLELPDADNPWLEGAGMFPDEPLFDDWQQAMVDYRRAANQSAVLP